MLWEEMLEGGTDEKLGKIEDDIREIQALLNESSVISPNPGSHQYCP